MATHEHGTTPTNQPPFVALLQMIAEGTRLGGARYAETLAVNFGLFKDSHE